MYPRKKPSSGGDYVVRDAPSDIVRGRPSRPPRTSTYPDEPPSSLPPEGEALLDAHLPRPPRVPGDLPISRQSSRPPAPTREPIGKTGVTRSTLRPRAPGHAVDVVRGVNVDAVGSDIPAPPRRDELKRDLDALAKTAPDEVFLAVEALHRFDDDQVLAALEKHFPGPLWFDRRHLKSLPTARQVSALGCALVSYGERAVPALGRLLVDRGPEPRFYASLVCQGIADARLLRPLGRVALGSDSGARTAALTALKAQATLAGYQGLLAWMRQVAVGQKTRQVWRVRSLSALAELGDATALDVMLECLGERDRSIARAAHEALVALTAHDLGSMRLQWRRWRKTQGNLPRVAWLIDGLSDRRDSIRRHALHELERISGIQLDLPADAPRSSFLEARERYTRWWQTTAPR